KGTHGKGITRPEACDGEGEASLLQDKLGAVKSNIGPRGAMKDGAVGQAGGQMQPAGDSEWVPGVHAGGNLGEFQNVIAGELDGLAGFAGHERVPGKRLADVGGGEVVGDAI